MSTLTIQQKESNSGTIHDIASDIEDREIIFGRGCKYAVILASYYGGTGYTTHRTEVAAAKESRKQREYSHTILDSDGVEYYGDYDRLIAKR